MPIIEKTFLNDRYLAVYGVDEIHDNFRLDQYTQIYLSNFSRQQVKKKIDEGEIKIVGRDQKCRPSTKVHYNDKITVEIPRTIQEDEYWNGEKIELQETPEIVHEDSNLLVISKPPFMATHPTGKHLFNCATVFFETKLGHTCHSIHRLDRETSGILLLGKNPKVASLLTPQFEEGKVKKCYFFIAKTDNPPKEDSFNVKERLGGEEKGLKRVYINNFPENSPDGKRAETTFKIIHRDSGYVLGLAFPHTGRQHQIRVHAMIKGLPLLGDKLYLGSYEIFQRFKDLKTTNNDHEVMEIPRHALHSIGINLEYESKRATFVTPIPKDLKTWMGENLRVDIQGLEKTIGLEIKKYFN
jgi:RluA family pseudouridine synthase